jgi:Tfp pilus assembly protein PilF
LAHLDLGIISIDAKNYEQAQRELREAIRLDGKKSDAHVQLARMYRAMGRADEARAEFQIVQTLKQNETQDELHKINGKAPAPAP